MTREQLESETTPCAPPKASVYLTREQWERTLSYLYMPNGCPSMANEIRRQLKDHFGWVISDPRDPDPDRRRARLREALV